MTDAGNAFAFDNSYARELDGFYAPWKAAPVAHPEMLLFNHALAQELGLDGQLLDGPDGAAVFSGQLMPEGAQPLAQAYAGHQFGGFSPQLGDGRALLIGELVDQQGHRRDLQLKGSGPTPFSRGGDGKAPLGPVLREYLMGEAMHALGIPTTRALAAVATNESVRRDGMLPGAVLTRVASSHVRVGTFQFFAARGETDKVQQLADYVIARHYSELADSGPAHGAGDDRYLQLLVSIGQRQAELVARWMAVGFIHGVMNTDNMAVSGETIDYGPCAFMDGYDPRTVFSSIDHQGRYAYANQPVIAQWNLARLAETLLPLIDTDEKRAVELATEQLNRFVDHYQGCWLAVMRNKLGLSVQTDSGSESQNVDDGKLVSDWFQLLESEAVDFTAAFRALAQVAVGDRSVLNTLFQDRQGLDAWCDRWVERSAAELADVSPDGSSDGGLQMEAMNAVNPVYIPRNHLVEAALDVAVSGSDLESFNELLGVLSDPFTERDGLEAYAAPAPANAPPCVTFCGT